MSNKATAQPLSVKFLASSFLVFWLVLAAFPFMWTLWGSFKVEGDFFSKANWANALFGYLLPFFEWNLWGHLSTTIIVSKDDRAGQTNRPRPLRRN